MSNCDDNRKCQTALAHFKDWSNYLLVTTVGALGWVATQDLGGPQCLKIGCLVLLGFSVGFAILTLAIIPHVAESIDKSTDSIYRVTAKVRLGPSRGKGKVRRVWLKKACWPQHVCFMVGVFLYVVASIWGTVSPSEAARGEVNVYIKDR